MPDIDFETRYNTLLNLYHQGDLDGCEAGCTTLLGEDREHFGVLQLLGVIHSRHGRHEVALDCLDRALSVQPTAASAHNNRANVLMQLDRLPHAVASFDRALDLGLENPFALNIRGTALQGLMQLDEALASYARAIELKPDLFEALLNRGELLLEIGRHSEAQDHLQRARAIGEDTERIDFALSAMGAAPPVTSTPPNLVRRLFDEYAHRFDEHLTQTLDYQVPTLVGEALARQGLANRRENGLDIADLGCGTGLCGPLLAPHARQLMGVDLSQRMLDRAQARGQYQSLDNAELTEWLRQRPASLDVAVAGDVLNYFGDLTAVMAATAAALRPGGVFVFTVEAADDASDAAVPKAGYRLEETRRFRHARDYLQKVIEEAGWVQRGFDAVRLRQERGAPVNGWLITLARPMA
jgi:predicted TPR repeat methyltransferase